MTKKHFRNIFRFSWIDDALKEELRLYTVALPVGEHPTLSSSDDAVHQDDHSVSDVIVSRMVTSF